MTDSKSRLRAASASGADYAIIAMNSAGHVTGWNVGACRLFGWDKADLLSQDAAQIWTPEDREAGVPEAERHKALMEGSAVGERWHMRRDGTRFWASGHLTPMDKAGVGGFLKILQDCSAPQMAEAASARSESRLRPLGEAPDTGVTRHGKECDRAWQLSPDLLLVAHLDARLMAVNPAWSATLGWAEHELVGQSALDFVHPDDRDKTLVELGRLAAGSPVRDLLNRQLHRDGSWRWITWTALPDNGLIYATGRDVTDERAANRVLSVANEQLHQSQKQELLGQLTEGLAHDFNNLLQGIGSNLDMLQLRLKQGRANEAAHYVETAHKGVDRAAALTLDLLAFAHRQ